MLSDDSAVSSVIREALPVIKGKVIIDMSTISPTTSIGLADQVRRGGGGNMMDAPVIGTSIHVEQKKIAVLVGGPRELFETAKDIIGATAAAVEYMGGNGMGLYAKLVNNLLLGAYVAAMGGGILVRREERGEAGGCGEGVEATQQRQVPPHRRFKGAQDQERGGLLNSIRIEAYEEGLGDSAEGDPEHRHAGSNVVSCASII